jgi:hypothetical protein
MVVVALLVLLGTATVAGPLAAVAGAAPAPEPTPALGLTPAAGALSAPVTAVDPTWARGTDTANAMSFATDFLGNSYVGRPGHVLSRLDPSGAAVFDFPATAAAPGQVSSAALSTVDRSLRVTVVTWVTGVASFGAAPSPITVDGGTGTGVLVQFDRFGRARWARALTSGLSVWRLAGNDQLIAVAESYGTATPLAGEVQAFDAATGAPRWTAPIAHPGTTTLVLPWALAVGTDQTVYVGGWMPSAAGDGMLTFGTSPTATIACAGASGRPCGFLAALDGATGGAKRAIAPGPSTIVYDIAADAAGVAVTGTLFGGPGSATFPGPVPVTLTSTNGTFVGSFDVGLDVRWARLTTPSAFSDVSIDPRHHVQVVGDHTTDATIGGGPGQLGVPIPGAGVWVASYDDAGALRWTSNAATKDARANASYHVTSDDLGVTRVIAEVTSATVGTGPNPIKATGGLAVLAAFAPDGPMPGSVFHPLPGPTRVLDSRTSLGGWQGTPLTQGAPRTFALPPASAGGATAAVVNITVTGSTTPSFLTAYPAGLPAPTASNLNFAKNETTANLVTVPLGVDGQIELATATGSTHVVVDLLGVFRAPDLPDPQWFTATAPTRLLDSRTATGGWSAPLTAGAPRRLTVAPAGPVPAQARTVVLSVAVTGGTANSYLQAYAAGAATPSTSNILFARGQTVANLVVVPIGDDGSVAFANQVGSVDVVADVVGFFDATPTAGVFHPIPPTRVLDDRVGTGGYATPWGPGTDRLVGIGAPGAMPASIRPSAVSANLTATNGTVGSYLRMAPLPAVGGTSTLLFAPGQTKPTAIVSGAGFDRTVSIFNALGTVDVILDVNGYYTTG